MSLSIDHSKYFQPAYFAQLGGVGNEGSQAASDGDTDDANASDAAKTAAPPPTSSTQLLSSNDMRLLMLRGVGQDGASAYEDILTAFKSDPANSQDPVAFLKNLSQEGIDLLKQAQSLPAGAQIDVGSLNKEEALNFILPQSGKVDLDNDGLVEGANGGKSFVFPPVNAPQDVKDAWNSATANMSESDKMLLSGKYLTMFVCANLRVDQNGNVTSIEPDQPGWRNIFTEDGFSYQDSVQQLLDGNEFSKNLNTNEIYQKTKTLLTQLQDAFAKFGVA